MLLSNVLRKENNNLDIFRLIAAFMVIYGHAYALLPTMGEIDLIRRILVFTYSGSLAVKIFFFLSGLVVTNSLISKRNIGQFVVARFFRLWPALAVVLALSAFVIGPIISTSPPQEYFSNPMVYKHLMRSLLMDIRYELPGVFQGNTLKAVNGSLWSIPFEVYAYIFLLGAFLLKALNSEKIFLPLFLIILIDPLVENKILFTWLPQNPEITMLAPCFALGSLFALLKEKIRINRTIFCGVWVLYYLFRTSNYNFYFLYLALFYSIVFISSQAWLVKYKTANDISYGVYLWGWPVQQLMAQNFPSHGIAFNVATSILISSLLGYISWRLIESRFIKIGTTQGKRFFSQRTADISDQGYRTRTP